MKTIIRLQIIGLFLLFTSFLYSQTLKRQASIGIQPVPVSEEIAKEKSLPSTIGILVNQVFPNSTASEIGLQNGDVILKMNGTEIIGIPELMQKRAELREGSNIDLVVFREGAKVNLKGKAIGIPREQSEHAEIIYDQIPFKGGVLRSIVSKPVSDTKKTLDGKYPTIFFIPGYTCSTVDNLNPIHPYRKVLETFSKKGYAIFRVEKPGMGDNINTGNCQQLGFDNELEAYIASYPFMKNYDFIDLENVFVFGHSMGGVYAPYISSVYDPKGVIVYGTLNETWYEYTLKMKRFQNPWIDGDWVQMEKDLRTLTRMWYQHFEEKKTTKELAEVPEFKELLINEYNWDGENQILGRHETFWQEIHDRNLTEAWSKTSSHLLSLYGEADLAAIHSIAHEEIAKIVNTYNPGKAKFELIEETDHSMIKVGKMKDGIRLSGSPEYRSFLENHFNYEMMDLIEEWIQSKV